MVNRHVMAWLAPYRLATLAFVFVCAIYEIVAAYVILAAAHPPPGHGKPDQTNYAFIVGSASAVISCFACAPSSYLR